MILERLMGIAKKEKISIDENAALLIAKAADGSLRDALVVLDQMVSFSTGKIEADDVAELLGTVHKEKVFELSNAVLGDDPGRVISVLDELINAGKDPIFIANSLVSHYRDLMVMKTVGGPTSDMALGEDDLARLKELAGKLSLEEIIYVLQNLTRCLDIMKGTMFTRAPLEITLIKLAKRKNVLSLPEIMQKLEKTNKHISDKGETPSYASEATQDTIREHPGGSVKQFVGRETENKDNTAPDDDMRNGNTQNEQSVWEAILGYVKSKKMSVFTFLSHARPVTVSSAKIVLGFGKDHVFNKEVLESENNKVLITEAAASIFGKTPKLEFKILEFLGESSKEAREAEGKKAMARELSNPVVEEAMDIFGGRVVRDQMGDS